MQHGVLEEGRGRERSEVLAHALEVLAQVLRFVPAGLAAREVIAQLPAGTLAGFDAGQGFTYVVTRQHRAISLRMRASPLT